MVKVMKCVAAMAAFGLTLGSATVSNAATRTLSAPAMTRTEAVWATTVFTLLNTERLLHGRPLLRSNPHLVNSAMYHDVRMARANSITHQLPHEPAFTDRELDFGYHWSTAAENCSVNPDVSLRGVLQVQRMMYHERPPGETGHRLNILSPNFRDVGIAVLIDLKNKRVWLTEDFGAPS